MSRIGLTYGDLTVIKEAPGSLLCRCTCGAEHWYTSGISKPTYQRRLKCERCAGHPCEICGTLIPAKAGRQSATCSEVCRKKRAGEKGSAYYVSIKDTPKWHADRQAYLEKLRARKADEPAFAEMYRARNREIQRKYQTSIDADPVRREAHLRSKRDRQARWLKALRLDPEAYKAYLESMRDWYAALSHEDKARLFKNYVGNRAQLDEAQSMSDLKG